MSFKREYTDWAGFKALVITQKNLTLQYHDEGNRYEIWATDGAVEYDISLSHITPTPVASDQEDFEDNHLPTANFAVGQRPYPFATGDFDFAGDGVFATIPFGTTADVDYLVTAAGTYVNGGEFLCKDAVMGDYIEVQVIDIDNVLGLGVNTVLKQWVTKWYIAPDTLQSIRTAYAAAFTPNLYMRVKYHSTGTTDVKLLGNYYFHKAI